MDTFLRLRAHEKRGAQEIRRQESALEPAVADRLGRDRGGQEEKEQGGRLRVERVERRGVARVREEKDQEAGGDEPRGTREVSAGRHENTESRQEKQDVQASQNANIEKGRAEEPARSDRGFDQQDLGASVAGGIGGSRRPEKAGLHPAEIAVLVPRARVGEACRPQESFEVSVVRKADEGRDQKLESQDQCGHGDGRGNEDPIPG